MRVMHVIDRLALGGAERTVVELARGCRSAGIDASVCLTRGGGALSHSLPQGTELFTLNRRHRWDFSAASRFADCARSARADVLHVHGRSSLLFVRAAGALRRLPPTLLHDHYGDGSRAAWALRLGAHTIARYVACSQEVERRAWKSGVPRSRTETIPAALHLSDRRCMDRRQARRRLGLDADGLIAVCVGGLRREKGQDLLLEALSIAGGVDGLTTYLVGGSRDDRFADRLRRRIPDLGLTRAVELAGERSDVWTWLAAADFAVHPSRIESGPLALIEYLAAGLPVVCSRAGEAARIAEEAGVEGFTSPGDVRSLRREIDLIRNLTAEERARRGKTGRRAAERELDLSQRLPAWVCAYERAAGYAGWDKEWGCSC